MMISHTNWWCLPALRASDEVKAEFEARLSLQRGDYIHRCSLHPEGCPCRGPLRIPVCLSSAAVKIWARYHDLQNEEARKRRLRPTRVSWTKNKWELQEAIEKLGERLFEKAMKDSLDSDKDEAQ